jgi:hypothetical protein
MKNLLVVEDMSEEELRFEDLQALHQNLTDEICLGEEAQSNNELFKRYIQAYNKLQRVKETIHKDLNEYTRRRNFW